MATQVETAAQPSTAFTKEELERMFEFDKIVKFRDSVTSGNHPRIKVPAHLAPVVTGTAASKSSFSTDPHTNALDSALGATVAVPPKTQGSSFSSNEEINGLAHQLNGQLSGRASTSAALPGLGYAPREPVGANGPGIDPVQAEFSLQRAKIEELLGAQVVQRSQAKPVDAFPDFVLDDVLRKARELEATFTPPPVAMPGNEDSNFKDIVVTASGKRASHRDGSADDETFYSSKFSTPEFGLTSRIPLGSDDDDVSMQDSSDYEPELDVIPAPTVSSQPLLANEQQRLRAQTGTLVERPDRTSPEVPLGAQGRDPGPYSAAQGKSLQASLYQGNPHQSGAVDLPQWGSSRYGPSGELPSTDAGVTSSGESSYRRQPAVEAPRQPSPFVRTHDLSPIAPQPAHVSSLTAVAQLPLVIQEQQQSLQATPAQVALLRREEGPQSSSDSSPQGGGSRIADKKKGKRKNSNKRKADLSATSPRIKAEPRSPSPILAPPAQRPYKRQRQAAPDTQAGGYPYDDEYSPTIHQSFVNSHRSRLPSRSLQDGTIPVVYEKVDEQRYGHPGDGGMSQPVDLHPRFRQQEYEIYETRPTSYATVAQYVQPARPPSAILRPTDYVVPASRTNLQPARAASHALIEASSNYGPPAAVRNGYANVYETSGRVSGHPEHHINNPAGSPTMAPPSSRLQHQRAQDQQRQSPPQARIVVDEFGREYYEPATAASRHQTAVEVAPRPAYESEAVYERPVSHQPYALPHQPVRARSQMPLAFEENRDVYGRTSPTFAAPRRVVTQPEYLAQDVSSYRREYSVRPTQQFAPTSVGRRTAVEDLPAREYMVRASTARPPEHVRYELPASGHYTERVGSIRAVDAGVPPGHEFDQTANFPSAYESHPREQPSPAVVESAYMAGHHGHGTTREYSARPEPSIVVQRAFSVRPGPSPSYYVERFPSAAGPPVQEYVYSDDATRRDMYR